MSFRAGYGLLAVAVAVFCVCGALIAWRLWPQGAARPPTRTLQSTSEPTSQPKPKPSPTPSKISTIIDLPGDPVQVRRGSVVAPRETHFALPTRIAANSSKVEAAGYFVADTLVSTTGGYMGKFPDAGQEADALAAQLAMNAAAMANVSTQTDVASDDDGGEDTPTDAAAQMLTEANSNQLEISSGQPQLKLAVLKTVLPEKIADLLIANGYGEDSARETEAASKAIFNVQTLPANAIALTAGSLDTSGSYRVTQFAMFENREYVGSIALFENGAYGEGARPAVPEGLMDDAPPSGLGVRYTLADGLYSAGLRNGMPEPVIREGIQSLSKLIDMKIALPADETFRILYARENRTRSKASGKIAYIGIAGSAGTRDCYTFEAADGGFRCFDPNAKPAAPSSGASAPSSNSGSTPSSLGDSGASSVGGILAPIKGAPVTSLYGMRFHPILHILRLHGGIDFGAPVGSQVRASADGKVEIAGPVSGFGNHIRIQHKGFETSYSHLSEIPSSIKPGVEVKEGEIIALSGNTGLSTGPHLHFEFYMDRAPVDPLPHLGQEVQATAPTAGSGGGSSAPLPPTNGPSGGGGGVSEAELAAFPAFKAQVDAAIEAVAH